MSTGCGTSELRKGRKFISPATRRWVEWATSTTERQYLSEQLHFALQRRAEINHCETEIQTAKEKGKKRGRRRTTIGASDKREFISCGDRQKPVSLKWAQIRRRSNEIFIYLFGETTEQHSHERSSKQYNTFFLFFSHSISPAARARWIWIDRRDNDGEVEKIRSPSLQR